jgi:hypothetical protein
MLPGMECPECQEEINEFAVQIIRDMDEGKTKTERWCLPCTYQRMLKEHSARAGSRTKASEKNV